MEKQINSITLLFLLWFLLLLTGCVSEEVKQNNRPDWIDKPEPNFVGICATQANSVDAQEQCAYQKGLAYIAMSKGVSPDLASTMMITQATTEKSGVADGQLQATVNMGERNIKLSASVIDKWHDEMANVLYVLIRDNERP